MTGTLLVQLRVLRFRFFQDGDVGVGVFPEGEEILISSFGLGGITFECVGAGEAEVGERASFARSCQSLVAEDLLKFDLCGRTIPGREQGLSTNISGVNVLSVPSAARSRGAEAVARIDPRGGLKNLGHLI